MSKEIETHKLYTVCPSCGHSLRHHTAIGGDEEERAPEKNDLNVCSNCGAWNKFDEQLKLVGLTQQEKDSLEPEMRIPMEKATEFIRKENNKNLN